MGNALVAPFRFPDPFGCCKPGRCLAASMLHPPQAAHGRRPMNKNAQDIMMGAPSTVEQKQLDELHIAIVGEVEKDD